MAEWSLIVATGPSLRRKDLELLRGHCSRVIAINCGVFYAPWADVVYAGDGNWWKVYGPKIGWFKGRRISRTARFPGVEIWRGGGWKRTGGNSGHQGIQWEVDSGGRNLALIGFDHQKTGGRAHVHADHPAKNDLQTCVRGKLTTHTVQLGNAGGIHNWPGAMNKTAKDLQVMGVRVVNLSRETALTCFPRMAVEEFLEQL